MGAYLSKIFVKIGTALAGMQSIVNESWANNTHIIQYAIYICYFFSFFHLFLLYFSSLLRFASFSFGLESYEVFRTKACCNEMFHQQRKELSTVSALPSMDGTPICVIIILLLLHITYSNDHVSLITRLKWMLCFTASNLIIIVFCLCSIFVMYYGDYGEEMKLF